MELKHFLKWLVPGRVGKETLSMYLMFFVETPYVFTRPETWCVIPVESERSSRKE